MGEKVELNFIPEDIRPVVKLTQFSEQTRLVIHNPSGRVVKIFMLKAWNEVLKQLLVEYPREILKKNRYGDILIMR